MNIQDFLNKLKNAVLGSEVKMAIHDAIKKAYEDAAEQGNANMEVELARGTEPTLNDRLGKMDDKDAEVTEQLAQTKSNLSNQPANQTQVFATVVMDDGWKEEYNVTFPYLESVGIKGSVAVVTANTDTNPAYMTTEELTDLSDAGWEILSHTVTHPELPSLSRSEIEKEFVDSKEFLESRGLEVNGVVYPKNMYNDDVLDIVRNQYNYAFAKYDSEEGNPLPYDQYAINRITLERPLADNKAAIDKAIKNNEWIVFMGHGMYFSPDRYPDDSKWPGRWDNNIQNMKDNIQYCLDNNVTFATGKEVIKNRGNAVTLGDRNVSKDYLMISKQGIIESSSLIERTVYSDGGVSNATPISEFEKNKISINTFMANDDAGFPTKGGTLITYHFGYGYRAFNGELSFQIWHPFNQISFYIRRWESAYNEWSEWWRQGAMAPDDKYVKTVILNNVQVPEIPANGYSWIKVNVPEVQGRSPITVNCHYNGLTSAVDVAGRSDTTGSLILVFRNFSSTPIAASTKSFTVSYSIP